nr:cryptochrome/photolyase family protein [Kofleriaceae bacterium]
MSEFLRQLKAAQPTVTKRAPRSWHYVAYDQLNDRLGPLATLVPDRAGIVLIECAAKARRRPYHKQKLAWLLSNQRHFALEQAQRGVAVRYEFAAASYASKIVELGAELGPLTMMQAAERELRHELAPLLTSGQLNVVPHTGWLTSAAEFQAFCGAAPWRMDAFYRGARRARDILMEGASPVGGKFSFDAENRQPYRGKPAAPLPLRFVPDLITEEVCAMVAAQFTDHPGQLSADAIAATCSDARAAWHWALTQALPHFGPFEDAMSTQSSTLFHTLIAPLLNLHRVLPADVINDAIMAPIDMASKEGFIRQVLGWREFVHHVHDQTDGFRNLAGASAPGAANAVANSKINDQSGDAGYGRYVGTPRPPLPREQRGVTPNLAAVPNVDLPPVFWGATSGLHCLDSVVADVWRTGYSHHITRLMVLGNIGTLLDISPRQLTDWFLIAYIDAYDWVVEPNVLGMATFGLG